MDELKPMIIKTEYLDTGNTVKAYIKVAEKTNAAAVINGINTEASSNIREPYDFRMHIFEIEKSVFEAIDGFELILTKKLSKPSLYFTGDITELKFKINIDRSMIISEQTAIERAERGIVFDKILEKGSCDGVEWVIEEYKTPDNAPVKVYTAKVDLNKAEIIAGTPHAEPVFKDKDIQTVMEECIEVEKKGREVLCASNADFFDMFGSCYPSGLCVSDSVVVANPEAVNPFFAIKKDGTPVIAYLTDVPLHEIKEAVGGGQILVKDGKITDVAVLQGFGEIPHPRTAFGIDAEGNVLITVVDGRRPVWSNGACLTELARLMISHGAVTALNADGGGSSTIIVRKESGLTMLNHPADLVRPMEDLIRPLFDSLVVVKK